jgi:hypothetical protein
MPQLDPLLPTPPRMAQGRFPPPIAGKRGKPVDREFLAGSRRNLEPGFGPTPGTEEDLTGLAASDSD